MKEHPVIHLRTAQDADDYCAMIADRAAEHTGRPVSHKVVAGVLLAMTEVSEEADIADGVDDEAQTYQDSVDRLSVRLSEVTNDMAELKMQFNTKAKLASSDISSLDERVSSLENYATDTLRDRVDDIDHFAVNTRRSVEALLAWRTDWRTQFADVTKLRNEVSDLRDEVEHLTEKIEKGGVVRWTES